MKADVAAPGVPVFDTHCHLDRTFLEDKFRKDIKWPDPNSIPPDPLEYLRNTFPEAFSDSFRRAPQLCALFTMSQVPH